MKEYVKGVHYGVLKSKKYKTNQLMIKFITPYQPRLAAVRAILSRMMEDGSSTIQSKSELEQCLAAMYGVSLAVNVMRKGHYHELTLTTTCVRPQLVGDKTLETRWLAIAKELLFNQSFEHVDTIMQTRFEREKTLLLDRLHRNLDDKRKLVVKRLVEHLFHDEQHDAEGGAGHIEHVAAVQYEELAQSYADLIANSQVYIVAQGDMSEETLTEWVAGLQLTDRDVSVDYVNNVIALPEQSYAEKIETVEGQQTNVAMGYQIGKIKDFEDRIIMQMAAALFVNLPTSRLFVELREKQSLAYAIYGSVDFNRELLVINAGIDGQKLPHLIREVEAERLKLIATLTDDTFFEEAKLTLLSSEIQSRDYQQIEVANYVSEQLYPHYVMTTEEIQRVMKTMQVADVVACLEQWQLVASYALVGGEA